MTEKADEADMELLQIKTKVEINFSKFRNKCQIHIHTWPSERYRDIDLPMCFLSREVREVIASNEKSLIARFEKSFEEESFWRKFLKGHQIKIPIITFYVFDPEELNKILGNQYDEIYNEYYTKAKKLTPV